MFAISSLSKYHYVFFCSFQRNKVIVYMQFKQTTILLNAHVLKRTCHLNTVIYYSMHTKERGLHRQSIDCYFPVWWGHLSIEVAPLLHMNIAFTICIGASNPIATLFTFVQTASKLCCVTSAKISICFGANTFTTIKILLCSFLPPNQNVYT